MTSLWKVWLKIVLICICRLPQLTVAIELVNEISRQLTDRKNEAVSEISNTFEELEKALTQRKTALITDLENICSTKQKVKRLLLKSIVHPTFLILPLFTHPHILSNPYAIMWMHNCNCVDCCCRCCRPSSLHYCKGRRTSRAVAASQSRH